MILPLMMTYQAIGMRNYAGLGLMRNHNAMLSMLNHVSFNGGMHGMHGMHGMQNDAYLRQLTDKETHMDCQNATYELLYQIALAQEEAAKKRMKEEAKSFSVFA